MSTNTPTRVSVIHLDPFTGIVLVPAPPFTDFSYERERSAVQFDSKEQAVAYCKGVIAAHPHVECCLTDADGLQHCFSDRVWIDAETERRMAAQDGARKVRWWVLAIAGVATALGAWWIVCR